MKLLGVLLVFAALIAAGFGIQRVLHGRRSTGFADVVGGFVDLLSTLP